MNREYIGARYVPKFFENQTTGDSSWLAGVSYEALTIVTYNNSSYTSKKPVPDNIGSPNANPLYWVETGNYNEQISTLTTLINNVNAVIPHTYNTFSDAIDANLPLNTFFIVSSFQSNGAKLPCMYLVTDISSKISVSYNDLYAEIISDEIEPCYFGAYGDGVHDDSVYINAWVDCITSLNKKGVFLTPHKCSNIVINSACFIDFNGFKLIPSGGTGYFITVDVETPTINVDKALRTTLANLYITEEDKIESEYEYMLCVYGRSISVLNTKIKTHANGVITKNAKTSHSSDGMFFDFLKIASLNNTEDNIGLYAISYDSHFGYVDINDFAIGIKQGPVTSFVCDDAHIWSSRGTGLSMPNGPGGYYGSLTLDSMVYGIDIPNPPGGNIMQIDRLYGWELQSALLKINSAYRPSWINISTYLQSGTFALSTLGSNATALRCHATNRETAIAQQAHFINYDTQPFTLRMCDGNTAEGRFSINYPNSLSNASDIYMGYIAYIKPRDVTQFAGVAIIRKDGVSDGVTFPVYYKPDEGFIVATYGMNLPFTTGQVNIEFYLSFKVANCSY